MSTTSPSVMLETRAPDAIVFVRETLPRLSFQRRSLRFARNVLTGMAVVFASLFCVGIGDYIWHVGHTIRFGFLMLMLVSVLAFTAYALHLLIRRRTLTDMARDLERAAGHKGNTLVTFAESLEHARNREPLSYMLARLGAQARRNLETIDLNLVAPRRGAARSLVLLLFISIVVLAFRVFTPAAFERELHRIVLLEKDPAATLNGTSSHGAKSGNSTTTIESIHVRVKPPVYSGLGVEEAVGDAPVRVLAGSEIEVELVIAGQFTGASLGYGGTSTQMRTLSDGNYVGSFVAQSSGVFEARILANHDQVPAPFVRAVEVYADTAPEARIAEPTKDQLLRSVPSMPISVSWTAKDDLGLRDVILKYIRSRGEGDAAQFVNGTIPMTGVDRSSSHDWSGRAALDLARLGVQAGDTLVFWVEARDQNPTQNNTGRSASLAVAIMAPEPVKLNLGDLGPTEIGQFLLSERMIILHTEKLHSMRSRIGKEEYLRKAQDIAAEQRDFKNSFNDYIQFEGAGEVGQGPNSVPSESVEQQVQDAETERTGVHMHGIPEPPPGSPSRVRDMVNAIRAMWDAENELSTGDTGKALVAEREALALLKRAQLAVRYVPPVVARSKPIDLKRRYAGELNEIKTRLERLSQPVESKERTALRFALSESYAALAELQATLDVPVTGRAGAVARARERAGKSADYLGGAGGEHASTIAEALGQLRVVENELSRVDVSGSADQYATRISKSMALLTQAAANLFAVAEARTRASSNDSSSGLPADDRRTADYFRRLNK